MTLESAGSPSTHLVMDTLRRPRSYHETIQHRGGDQLRNATGTVGRLKSIRQRAPREQLVGDDLRDRLEQLVRLPIPSHQVRVTAFAHKPPLSPLDCSAVTRDPLPKPSRGKALWLTGPRGHLHVAVAI